MKGFVQEGDVITFIAPYAVVSGAGVQIGSVYGVAQTTAAISTSVEVAMEGVFSGMTKTAAQAWAVGVPIYWDNSTRALTTTVSTNKLVGYATVAALSADTVGTVWLCGL